VGHQQSRNAQRRGLAQDHQALFRRQVTGAQDYVGIANLLQDGPHRLNKSSVGIEYGDTDSPLPCFGAEHLGFGDFQAVPGMNRGKPDLPGTERDGCLHRNRIQPADGQIERQSAEHLDIHVRRDQSGAVGCQRMMALEHQPAHSSRLGTSGQRQIVQNPRVHVRCGMDMQIDRTGNIKTHRSSCSLIQSLIRPARS